MIIEYIVVGAQGGIKAFGWDGENNDLKNLKVEHTGTGTYKLSWDALASQPGVAGTVNASADLAGKLVLNASSVTTSSLSVVIRTASGQLADAEFTCTIMH